MTNWIIRRKFPVLKKVTFFLLKAIEKERADLKNESNEVCVEKFF